jgi:hypothetical protein
MKENALEEVKNNDYQRRMVENINLKNLSPSDKADLSMFLFGQDNVKIVGHDKPKKKPPKQKMSKREAQRLAKKYKEELKKLYQRQQGAYEMFINDKGKSLDKVNAEKDIVLKRLSKVNKMSRRIKTSA